jgi:hypothetical protein
MEAPVFIVTYVAVFSALAICAGTLVVKMYEWRQDVLYGPYIHREHRHRKIKG